MIERNRIYKRKRDGKYCYVEKYCGGSIHGTFVDENLVPYDGFTATIENFEKAVYKSPIKVTNTTIIGDREIKGKDTKVIYKLKLLQKC